MPEPTSKQSTGSARFDIGLRALIAIVFLYFGIAKLTSGRGSAWGQLFHQIGAGDWLRYAAAVLEILGAVLVCFSRTVNAGVALLGGVMLAAIAITLLVLHSPAQAFIPFAFLCALLAFFLHHRRTTSA